MRLLTDENVDHVLWKAKQGMALNLSELSIASGYNYEQWKRWKARGLPLIAGKLPLKPAIRWVKRYEVKVVSQSQDRRRKHHRPEAANRFCEQA